MLDLDKVNIQPPNINCLPIVGHLLDRKPDVKNDEKHFSFVKGIENWKLELELQSMLLGKAKCLMKRTSRSTKCLSELLSIKPCQQESFVCQQHMIWHEYSEICADVLMAQGHDKSTTFRGAARGRSQIHNISRHPIWETFD
ncbi:hypothetical protein WN943_023536 [Citrus x changshan-huyou]